MKTAGAAKVMVHRVAHHFHFFHLFRLAFVVVLLGGLAFLLWRWARRLDLAAIERIVRWRFPATPRIQTSELAALLKSNAAAPTLLDVRPQKEFSVGHLAGARQVNPAARAEECGLALDRTAPIVTYCSVGYRSAALAERLRRAGYTNVRNLEGSIFRWANENRPMVNAAGSETRLVHPYSRFWSRLVAPEHRGPVD